jgi:hypothetical protein
MRGLRCAVSYLKMTLLSLVTCVCVCMYVVSGSGNTCLYICVFVYVCTYVYECMYVCMYAMLGDGIAESGNVRV